MNNDIIGMWGLSNWGGVAVLELNYPIMLVQYYEDEPMQVNIEYDEYYGKLYIMVHDIKLYIDDCMRVK